MDLDKSERSSLRIRIWILAPCFHDTQSFAYLIRHAKKIVSENIPNAILNFVLVDDSGGEDLQIKEMINIPHLTILTVPYNLGHQAAIVFGLRKLATVLNDDDYIVTMDSDGEDRPEDIQALLEPLFGEPNNLFEICLAQRTKRNESIIFKVLYSAFKIFFQTLTGTLVRNGNFAAFRGWFVRHTLFHLYFDYCYSSSLLALPFSRHNVPLARGIRYYGKSKMTLVSLVSHGFRMLLPFTERIAIRAIILSSLFFVIGVTLCLVSVVQSMLGAAPSFIILIAGLSLLGLATIIAASSCIFFQVINQTKAISLHGLTCVPANLDNAHIFDDSSNSIANNQLR